MEGSTSKNIPGEIQSFLDRLTVLSNGTKSMDELIDYDFTNIVIKIKYLAVDPSYKTAVLTFLQSTALPIIDDAYLIIDQIIAGITQKVKYGKLSSIKALQLYGNSYKPENFPDEIIGYMHVTGEDIKYARALFLKELTYYSHHLSPLVNVHQVLQPNTGIVIKDKIKTNLNVDELAMFFKILNEYEVEDRTKKKVLSDYGVKRNLHRAVVQCFSTTGSVEINFDTYETKYGTTDQLTAVDFWITKFKSLQIAATNLKLTLEDREDKSIQRKKTK